MGAGAHPGVLNPAILPFFRSNSSVIFAFPIPGRALHCFSTVELMANK
jgi:hypothetical protein